jgi:hypothetical protein
MGVMAAVGTGERNVSAHLVPIRRACTFNRPNMACDELARKLTNLHTICRTPGILRSDEVCEDSFDTDFELETLDLSRGDINSLFTDEKSIFCVSRTEKYPLKRLL